MLATRQFYRSLLAGRPPPHDNPVLKASAGLMFNVENQRDRHTQLGIGIGF